MSTLAIGTYENKNAFRPGETVSGRMMWMTEREPDSVEARLFWYTVGKGTQDVEIVAREAVRNPGRKGEAAFTFVLPDQPYSFSGRLVSLQWALEIVVRPGNEAERFLLNMSPTGSEIVLRAGGKRKEGNA